MNQQTKPFHIRPYVSSDCAAIADAHVHFYQEELGWNDTFCQYAISIPYAFDAAPKSPRAEIWVAEAEGKFAGCIMLKEMDQDPSRGQLRIFIVEKWARKHGIGSALLETFMTKAREAGYKHLCLETCELLESARRAYAKLGFVCTNSWTTTKWRDDGQAVTEEYWELNLG